MNCSETCKNFGSILVPVWRSEVRNKNTTLITNETEFISKLTNPNWKWNHLQLTGGFPHEAIIFNPRPSNEFIIIYDSYVGCRNPTARMYTIDNFTDLAADLFSSDETKQRNAYNLLFDVEIRDNINISSVTIFPLK